MLNFDFGFGFPDFALIAYYIKSFYFFLKSSDWGRLILAFVIMTFAFMGKRLFSHLAVKFLNFLVLKKITYGSEKILREISYPLEFIPIVVGVYFAITMLKIPSSMVFYTRNFLKSLYIFNVTWFIYSFINPIAVLFRRAHLDNTKIVIITWGVRIVKFLIFIIGLSALLENWGVRVSTLIASLGLVGMAVALGAQDMFKNIISGVAIISEKRFNVGDIVKVENGVEGSIEGIVENIGFRSTMIRKFDRAPLYVPNTTLADAAVINFSSRLYRRIDWAISLEYRTTANQLRYIRQEIEKYMMESSDFVKPPEAALQVRIDKFSSSSIDLLVYCFTNTNVWADWLVIKENLILKIKELVEEAGAFFAFPSSSLYIREVSKNLIKHDLPLASRNKLSDERGDVADDDNLFPREGDI